MQMSYAGERPGAMYERYSDGSPWDGLRGCLKHRPPHKYMLEMGCRYRSHLCIRKPYVHRCDEYDEFKACPTADMPFLFNRKFLWILY